MTWNSFGKLDKLKNQKVKLHKEYYENKLNRKP